MKMKGSNCLKDHSLPLDIVLGSLANEPLSSTQVESDATTTYILGTSYFATPRLGAALKLNKDGRVPMSDRKGAFDHYRPKALMLSTIRVTAINISTTLSTYFSDQLQSEQRIEGLVDSGKITPYEADELNEQWEEREWKLRTDMLPKRIGWALLRFHTCTGLMRFYEFVLGKYVLKVDGAGAGGRGTLTDGSASLRTSQVLHNSEHSPGKVMSSDGLETSTSRELRSQMFTTCLWANIIPFLAELTVQQGVLIYGYGVYYLEKKRKRKEREERKKSEAHDLNLHDEGCKEEEEEEEDKNTQQQADGSDDGDDVSEAAYALSFVFRSSRLSIARSMSWIVASFGGAVGSSIYPGWGTVFGNQIGDALVGALID
eukprot:g10507.t1 g10507   contig4:2006437-2007766(-)